MFGKRKGEKMLVGLTEKLERALSAFLDDEEDTDWADIMTLITDSVAAGDLWQVPVRKSG